MASKASVDRNSPSVADYIFKYIWKIKQLHNMIKHASLLHKIPTY